MGFTISQPGPSSSLATLIEQTDQLESLATSLTSMAATEGVSVASIQAATANLLTLLTAFESGALTDLNAIEILLGNLLIKSTQIYGATTNIESAIDQLNVDNKPLVFLASETYLCQDYPASSALSVAANPLRRGLKVVNASGEPDYNSSPINGECWIFGSYRDGNVDEANFDFVIEPGQQILIDAPAGNIWLCCIAQTQPLASFVIVEYQ